MHLDGEQTTLEAAEGIYCESRVRLFRDLVTFVRHRWEAACRARDRLAAGSRERGDQAASLRHLHAMLSECWDALDGEGRLINVCLHPRFPQSGLFPPERMTRQCTFYTVRRDLHRHPRGRRHPIAELMWEQTGKSPDPAYERLSFLYNVSRFLPVPLAPGGALPGWGDLPEHVRSLVRDQDVQRRPMLPAVDAILRWQKGFLQACYAQITAELQRQGS